MNPIRFRCVVALLLILPLLKLFGLVGLPWWIVLLPLALPLVLLLLCVVVIWLLGFV